MNKIWFHFGIILDQNLIKNQSKSDIEFKVRFTISIFSLFCWFLTNFGPTLVPKELVFSERNWVRKRFRPPSALQRLSGSVFGARNNKNVIWLQRNAFPCAFWMWKRREVIFRFPTSLPFYIQKGHLAVQNWYLINIFALSGTSFSRVSIREVYHVETHGI